MESKTEARKGKTSGRMGWLLMASTPAWAEKKGSQMLKAMVVFAFVLCSSESYALTAYETAFACGSTSNDYTSGHCAGVAAALFFYSQRLGVYAPDGVNHGQVQLVIKAYAERHPELLQLELEELGLQAMREAWPCPH